MARNVEIKARVRELAAIRAKAIALASRPAETVHQRDIFFEMPQGRLKVREFSDGSGELIAYERADVEGPKVSTYERVACPDARALARTLAAVLPRRGTVVKRREVILVGRTRVHLDEVENLGSFVELEVVMAEDEPIDHGIREAHELLNALGIPPAALVPRAYIDLLGDVGGRADARAPQAATGTGGNPR